MERFERFSWATSLIALKFIIWMSTYSVHSKYLKCFLPSNLTTAQSRRPVLSSSPQEATGGWGGGRYTSHILNHYTVYCYARWQGRLHPFNTHIYPAMWKLWKELLQHRSWSRTFFSFFLTWLERHSKDCMHNSAARQCWNRQLRGKHM